MRLRSLRLAAAVLALALLSLTVTTVPAQATPVPAAPPEARISQLSEADGVLGFVLGTSGFSGTVPDPKSVRVLINGASVLPTVTAADGTGADRTAVLVIDVSLSMEERIAGGGTRIDAAQDAARTFLDTVPADVRVGLVTFSGEVSVPVDPTTDHDAVRRAIDGLELAEDTALYQGVQRGVELAGVEGARSVLVLSDGQNDGAEGTLAETTAAISASGVTLDVIGLGNQQDAGDLTAMAMAGGGQAVGADRADDLAEQFQAAADAISSQLSVSVVVPERFYGGTVAIEAQVTLGGVPVVDQASYNIDAAPTSAEAGAPLQVTVPPAIGSWAAILALVGVCIGVGSLLTVAALTLTKQHTRRARIARLVQGSRGAVDDAEAPTPRERGLREPAVALADRFLRARDLDRTLTARLTSAGLPLRAPEWLLLHVGAALGAGLLLALASGNLIAAVVGVAIGAALPWVFLLSRARSRHEAFATALPETLQTIASSLSAGLTLQQATESVATDGRPPVADEVRRALVEVRLGMPLEDALDRVAVRMASPDFAWVVMATRIQREVGGNLPELLEVVAGTLRDRDRIRRQASVLSAEGRISAWVVGLLPIVFACYMLVVRPSYLSPLVTDPLGWALLLGGATLFLGGVVWLARISRLKV